ncbi:hypothetical protein E4U42_004635 [Claviceps africana]|uniref:Rhodopsin domain-containing protein n=1 Tax=Claviceps africana TaxID=83212 RepID=A0A8K0J5D7_9HYPO|nr:hypothetical protein E4U42_004635 [Claviceps africana]
MAAGNGDGFGNVSRATALSSVFFVLTPTFVMIRFWSRACTKCGLGSDDLVILVSFACSFVVQILTMIAYHYRLGQHVKDVAHDNELVLYYIAQIFCNITASLTKSSVLLFYLREFVQRWFRVCSCTLLGIIAADMIAAVGVSIWQCSPIEGAWDESVRSTCISLPGIRYANAVFSISTDVLILLLPIQPIWQSKLPLIQKRTLVLVFALGGLATVSSIMRAITLGSPSQTTGITYDIIPILWAMAEQNVAIICACMPMCRIVLAFIFPNAFASAATGASSASDSKGRLCTLGSIPRRGFRSPSHREWHPYSGPPPGGSSRSIARYHADASTSQVSILASMARPGVSETNGRIWKTTQYEISYENLHQDQV